MLDTDFLLTLEHASAPTLGRQIGAKDKRPRVRSQCPRFLCKNIRVDANGSELPDVEMSTNFHNMKSGNFFQSLSQLQKYGYKTPCKLVQPCSWQGKKAIKLYGFHITSEAGLNTSRGSSFKGLGPSPSLQPDHGAWYCATINIFPMRAG